MSEGAVSTETQAGTESVVTETQPVAGWRDGFENHPALADFPDSAEEALPEVAKSFLATKELVGRKGVILAKEGDPTDQARFFKEAMNRPETVEGYDLSQFAVPEGLPWNEDFQTKMVSALHAEGLPGDSVVRILNSYAEGQVAQYQEISGTIGKGREAAEVELKTELGMSYEASMASAVQAFEAAAGERADEVRGLLLQDGTKLGDHPAFLRTFINIGKQYSEHGFVGDKGSGGFVKSPEVAQQELSAIEKNPALYDENHPEQKALQQRKDELSRMAFPESKTTTEVL